MADPARPLAVVGRRRRRPVSGLFTAFAPWDLADARDRAAVIDWRIEDVNEVIPLGRCRGCRAFPTAHRRRPKLGPYLHARSHLVVQLADQVRLNSAAGAPAWAAQSARSPCRPG